MLWWLSQLTTGSILGPAPRYMMTATAALSGISEVHLSWLRSLLLLRGFGEGSEPQSSHLYIKYELQSPQTRHFNDCGSSALYP